MKSRLNVIAAAFLCATAATTHAQTSITRPSSEPLLRFANLTEQLSDPSPTHTDTLRPVGTAKIYWENDGALHDPTDSYDRHYTNGFAIVLEHQPDWADSAIEYMPFAETFASRHGKPRTGAGYLLSQLIFTPTRLRATAPIPTDQPYAGYLYGGVFLQRQGDYRRSDHISVLDHFEINIGVVGEEALGKDIQTWVHDTFQGRDPRGWDNQLATEVTAQFYYRRKWRADLGSINTGFMGDLDMQVIPQVGVALGTVYRQADAAITFRIGQQLPDDFGPGRIRDLQSTTGDPFLYDGWSWYAFASLGGRAVQHELFLDGSNYSDPSLSVDREPFVGEVQAGLAVSYRPNVNHRFDLSWGLTIHTDTFDGPGDQGTDSYGTFVFAWVRSF